MKNGPDKEQANIGSHIEEWVINLVGISAKVDFISFKLYESTHLCSMLLNMLPPFAKYLPAPAPTNGKPRLPLSAIKKGWN